MLSVRRALVTITRSEPSLDRAIVELLACPNCHAPLTPEKGVLRCTARQCQRVVPISDGIVMAAERTHGSFFDDAYEIMCCGSQQSGIRCMCYSKQTKWLDSQLRDLSSGGGVVLDVGCGPLLPYQRSERYFLIGVDTSVESIKRNGEVDLRVFGSAARLPLRNASVDVIVCFYSIHHMVGRLVSENKTLVLRAFSEFSRVLKPGGRVYVFEVSPWWPVFIVQLAVWNIARRLRPRLDMFFWRGSTLRDVSLECLPSGTQFREREFKAPPWITFPFIFTWPGFRLPRFFYPFRAYVYEWRIPPEGR